MNLTNQPESTNNTLQQQQQANNNNNNNKNSNTMMDSYRVGYTGAIKRIGTPNEHDVLSGRGGAINSHIGNQHFREWVRVRREQYNLAKSKAEKALVANEVMDLVRNQNPPGRFLQRDQSSSSMGVTWWVEVDEIKAMAKTSQALREGAPSIRAAHKDDPAVSGRKRTRKSSKSKSSSTSNKRTHQTMQQQSPFTAASTRPDVDVNTPMPPLEMTQSEAMRQLKANVEAAVTNTEAATTVPAPTYAPLMSTTDFENVFGRPAKRSRYTENLYLPGEQQPHIVKPDEETPPLEPMPSPVPLSDIPELGPNFFPVPSIPKREASFHRSNSLALSDIGSMSGSDNWGDLKFVNPFEGDSDEYMNALAPPMVEQQQQQQHPQQLRTTSTSSSRKNNNAAARQSSRKSLSSMSLGSDLSDLLSAPAEPVESEFGEGMKAVYDVVNPGLASPGSDEPIPTHLYPYRGSSLRQQSVDSQQQPQLIF